MEAKQREVISPGNVKRNKFKLSKEKSNFPVNDPWEKKNLYDLIWNQRSRISVGEWIKLIQIRRVSESIKINEIQQRRRKFYFVNQRAAKVPFELCRPSGRRIFKKSCATEFKAA